MPVMKICKYCNGRFSVLEKHMCDGKLQEKRRQEKQHREVTKEANAAIANRKWRSFRKKIILRDGGYCQRCKAKYNKYVFGDLEVHHIIPRIRNLELVFDESNVVTVCKQCNLELGLDGIDFEWNPPEMDNTIHLGKVGEDAGE